MKRFKNTVLAVTLSLSMLKPVPSRADLFGGDVVVLTQILVQAIQQLVQLKQIVSSGADTLSLWRQINQGIRDGISVIQILNPKFNPGLYGSLETAEQVARALQDIYGLIPQSAEARLQEAQDRSASESIAMNGTLFRFADQADEESKRIISHSRLVNPQGAAKLTVQSVAVLIGVSTQVLRTNSMMLKLMGENLALQNRKEKLQSAQFKSQYDGISGALNGLPKNVKLPAIKEGE